MVIPGVNLFWGPLIAHINLVLDHSLIVMDAYVLYKLFVLLLLSILILQHQKDKCPPPINQGEPYSIIDLGKYDL